ncbi:hypothetical protein [Kitasatospora sp. NPDC001683]
MDAPAETSAPGDGIPDLTEPAVLAPAPARAAAFAELRRHPAPVHFGDRAIGHGLRAQMTLFRELFTRLPEARSAGEPVLVPSSFDPPGPLLAAFQLLNFQNIVNLLLRALGEDPQRSRGIDQAGSQTA